MAEHHPSPSSGPLILSRVAWPGQSSRIKGESWAGQEETGRSQAWPRCLSTGGGKQACGGSAQWPPSASDCEIPRRAVHPSLSHPICKMGKKSSRNSLLPFLCILFFSPSPSFPPSFPTPWLILSPCKRQRRASDRHLSSDPLDSLLPGSFTPLCPQRVKKEETMSYSGVET